MSKKSLKSKIKPSNRKNTSKGKKIAKSIIKPARAKKTRRKFKGVGYTNRVVKKYFKSKKRTGRSVFDELKAKGLKPTVKNIRELLAKKRKVVPEVDQIIIDNIWQYIEINDGQLSEEIKDIIPEDVTIVSKLFPIGVEIQGGTIFNYENTFKQFVNYCNALYPPPRKSPVVPHIKYKEQVYWNDKKKRYEIKLISCDEDGNLVDFGFVAAKLGESVNPDESMIKASELPIEKPVTTKQIAPKTEIPLPEEKVVEKKIELSKQREKTILAKEKLQISKEKAAKAEEKVFSIKLKTLEKFDKMLAKKQISKKTYEQMVKNLYK